MKKLTVGLSLVFAGYAANSFAALPTGVSSRCDVNVPSFCGGFTFGLTGLYWRVSSPELDFGVSYPNTTSFFTDSGDFTSASFHANSNRIKHDFNWAWSANIGYIFPCSGNDVNLTYTHYDHDRRGDSRDFGFPTFLPLSSIGLAPFIFDYPLDSIEITGIGVTTVPVAFTAVAEVDANLLLDIDPSDVTRVAAKADFENNTWDLDFGQTINVGCNFRLRWFGGLRYTRLKNNLDVVTDAVGSLILDSAPDPLVLTGVTFSVTTAGVTTAVSGGTAILEFDVDAFVRDVVHQKSDFNGIGPRFGLTGDYHFGGGFGLIGSLSTSLLVGNVESRLRTRIDVVADEVLPGVVLASDAAVAFTGLTSVSEITAFGLDDFDPEFVELGFNHPDETRVVPNIDAKIGLDWTYQFCNCSHSKLTIEAGYMVSHYFNAVDRLSVIEAIAPELRTRHTVDVSFDGPYIGVQVAL